MGENILGCPCVPISRWRIRIEIALVFAVFCVLGAWPVPDVNESHYLGRAIHFWNPDWAHGDFFLESADTHKVFYFTFGWLSLLLGPAVLAWTGRLLAWLLLAWSWRRLSIAIVPRPWYSVLTAAVFVCLTERCHMAGEWVIGGVEAKDFAYVFVFLGLEAIIRNRWNRGLLLFGAAAAFHVLVGGWAVVAAGVAWLRLRCRGRPNCDTPPLRLLWPGLLGGLLLSLPGLWPSLALDWGVDAQIAHRAHEIYVFERLPHHLVLAGMHREFIARFALLCLLWLLLGTWEKRARLPETQQVGICYLRAFITGAVAITLAGAAINLLIYLGDRGLAADLLRYYWFRLSDVLVPLGVALEGVALAVGLAAGGTDTHDVADITNAPQVQSGGTQRSRWRRTLGLFRYRWLALLLLLAGYHLVDRVLDYINSQQPRSHKIDGMEDFEDWREICEWVATSGKIPPGARFLTPRMAQTFKWYTGHSEVATWKDIPQDATELVQWWARLQDLYATGLPPPQPRWRLTLTDLSAERLRKLGTKYGADYLIDERSDSPPDLPLTYGNERYGIYRLR
jgi:hypothetical protein